MRDRYDVAVIGGGPAGAAAAWKAAQSGAATVLLERDREIGVPVRCGEMASQDFLERYFPLPERLIANRIQLHELVSPDGSRLVYKSTDKTVMLERKLFDAYVAELASRSGAELLTRADATGMTRSREGWIIRFTHQGEPRCIESRLVIAADGVESRAARWAGLQTALALHDLASCFQYDLIDLTIENPHLSSDYVGTDIAPGGYLWIFPKSDRRANVGVGVLPSRAGGRPAKYYLDRFLEQHFPQARPAGFVCGGVPLAKPLRDLAVDGLLVAGDAARLVEPLSGAGIHSAVCSGCLAGETAGLAYRNNRWDRKLLSRYTRLCRREVGKSFNILYAAKQIFQAMSDNELCRVLKLLHKSEPERFSVFELGRLALKNDPRLLASLSKGLWRSSH